jgi:phosphoribosyl 1,2-cyclic phosphodiesterase
MKLTFLGTRGNIRIRSARHQRHTSLLVSYRGEDVLVDCGQDWLDVIHRLKPSAIVLTHAHPDHVGGLARGSPAPVYATADVWRAIGKWPIRDQRRLRPRAPLAIRGLVFEAFPLDHSVAAPASGFRITGGAATIFYAPDVLDIHDRAAALNAVKLYVGDGASVARPIVQRRDGTLIGHASIARQLLWCHEEGVSRAIFTHCGSGLTRNEHGERTVTQLAESHGVDARVASDGYAITIR